MTHLETPNDVGKSGRVIVADDKIVVHEVRAKREVERVEEAEKSLSASLGTEGLQRTRASTLPISSTPCPLDTA